MDYNFQYNLRTPIIYTNNVFSSAADNLMTKGQSLTSILLNVHTKLNSLGLAQVTPTWATLSGISRL